MSKRMEDSLEELRTGLGSIAEMSLVFFRAAIGAGASISEATTLTQAYLSAMVYGSPQKESNEGGE